MIHHSNLNEFSVGKSIRIHLSETRTFQTQPPVVSTINPQGNSDDGRYNNSHYLSSLIVLFSGLDMPWIIIF